MQHLQPEELLIWKNENKPHLLVDIREEYEVAICTLDGMHIPMEHVIEKKFPGDTIYSLAGGVHSYAEQCAPEIKCSL